MQPMDWRFVGQVECLVNVQCRSDLKTEIISFVFLFMSDNETNWTSTISTNAVNSVGDLFIFFEREHLIRGQ